MAGQWTRTARSVSTLAMGAARDYLMIKIDKSSGIVRPGGGAIGATWWTNMTIVLAVMLRGVLPEHDERELVVTPGRAIGGQGVLRVAGGGAIVAPGSEAGLVCAAAGGPPKRCKRWPSHDHRGLAFQVFRDCSQRSIFWDMTAPTPPSRYALLQKSPCTSRWGSRIQSRSSSPSDCPGRDKRGLPERRRLITFRHVGLRSGTVHATEVCSAATSLLVWGAAPGTACGWGDTGPWRVAQACVNSAPKNTIRAE